MSLRRAILEKMKVLFSPDWHCPIDCVLGEFIEANSERYTMKSLFKRESEGLYQFGTRRITIKLEKGSALFVRVGGGYMGI